MIVFLTLASGGLIGLVLGLVGGGGSILAVPLLIYVVGMPSPHAALGTAAVAVAANALVSLYGHARAGRVKWQCASVFTAFGVLGATLGAAAGKAIDGQMLLSLFGALMVGIGAAMLLPRRFADEATVRLTRRNAPALLPGLVASGAGVGLLAGFFGIGGGVLIVPALMRATRMPMANAIGTSLVVISALGMTSATSYALNGHVDGMAAGLLVLGGVAGATVGSGLGRRLAAHRRLMEHVFAAMVIAAGLFISIKGI